jgi:hypothetical protein
VVQASQDPAAEERTVDPSAWVMEVHAGLASSVPPPVFFATVSSSCSMVTSVKHPERVGGSRLVIHV